MPLMTALPSLLPIGSSNLNLPALQHFQERPKMVAFGISGKPARGRQENSEGTPPTASRSQGPASDVRASARGSRSAASARRRGAHSDGGRRSYLQRSFHLPIFPTSSLSNPASTMPHPLPEASVARTDGDHGRPKLPENKGTKLAQTRSSRHTESHRGLGVQ